MIATKYVRVIVPYQFAVAAGLSGIGSLIAAMRFAAGSGMPAAILCAMCTIVCAMAVREERLVRARQRARDELDRLREEMRQALAHEGEHYAWMDRVSYRPAFEALLRNTRQVIGTMELRAQELEKKMSSRRWFHSTRSLREDWDGIEFEANRAIEGMSDHECWEGAADWDGFRRGFDEEFNGSRPPLRVVAGTAA